MFFKNNIWFVASAVIKSCIRNTAFLLSRDDNILRKFLFSNTMAIYLASDVRSRGVSICWNEVAIF